MEICIIYLCGRIYIVHKEKLLITYWRVITYIIIVALEERTNNTDHCMHERVRKHNRPARARTGSKASHKIILPDKSFKENL